MIDKSINMNMLSVVIQDRTGQVFQGEVAAVSSVNTVGAFDVLPLHSNFVTTISQQVTIFAELAGQPKVFQINSGLLRATNNVVEVFIGL